MWPNSTPTPRTSRRSLTTWGGWGGGGAELDDFNMLAALSADRVKQAIESWAQKTNAKPFRIRQTAYVFNAARVASGREPVDFMAVKSADAGPVGSAGDGAFGESKYGGSQEPQWAESAHRGDRRPQDSLSLWLIQAAPTTPVKGGTPSSL